MAFQFKIDGIEDIQKALGDRLDKIKDVFKKNIDEGIETIKKSAKSKAPKRIGNLINAIEENTLWDKYGKISRGVGIAINDVFKKADGWYARMQEKGTSKMKARPYLRPALNENKAQILSKIENELKEVIRNDT